MDLVEWSRSFDVEFRQFIAPFWLNRVMDFENHTFAGEVDSTGNPLRQAPKGGILTARILWTFSHAWMLFHEDIYRKAADEAFRFLINFFWDPKYGGTYWLVDWQGLPLDTKKHLYSNAFSMYALVEYHRATGNPDALEKAKEIFRLVEQFAHDVEHLGWLESFERDWSPLADSRLAEGEHNAPKSMNTHLHWMEAMTNLLRVWRDPLLEERQAEMLRLFLERIIHSSRHQLILFLERDWTPLSEIVSFGHDIEASWLLVEAAEVLGKEGVLREAQERSLLMVEAVVKGGLDSDGALVYEADSHGWVQTNKDWWPQAEAVVGFFNAYQLSGEEKYLQLCARSWNWIQTKLRHPTGEWRWGTDQAGNPLQRELAGFWKCPYHNSRMCFEILERVGRSIGESKA